MTLTEHRSWLNYFTMSRLPNTNTENETNTQNKCKQFFKIHYADCTDKMTAALIAIVGLIMSLWADCILVIVCTQDSRYGKMEYSEKMVIQTSQLSHFLIVTTCTGGLLYGIKKRNKSYFTPWIFTKLMELVVIFLGIMFLSTGHDRYLGVIPFGICVFIIGLYITFCVLDTYRNNPYFILENRQSNLRQIRVDPQIIIRTRPHIIDPPPSYDSFIAQGQNMQR